MCARQRTLLGKPNKTSILFEKGVIWSGTQNEAVLHAYANLALLLGSVGRPGQVFGRQGGHQSAIMYDFDWPHPQANADLRGNLWQQLQKGAIDLLLVGIANPIRMQQQSTQLRQFVEKVPFVIDLNIRPSDITEVADVVLPSTAWGEYTYTRENLERRVRVNQQFYDPPGEARPDYLIYLQIGKKIADKYGILASQRVSVLNLGGRLQRPTRHRRREKRRVRQGHPGGARVARHERSPGAVHPEGQHPDRNRADV